MRYWPCQAMVGHFFGVHVDGAQYNIGGAAPKKQAKQVVAEKAASVNMPYVIERWPGGMLTNFPTIRTYRYP